MEGNSGNLAKREHRGGLEDEGRNAERERVHRLHAPFLLRVDRRTKDRESMSRQLRETPMEEAGEAEGRREKPRDRRKSFERKREMGMKGDLENSGTPKSAREREREQRNGWKRWKEGGKEKASGVPRDWWTLRDGRRARRREDKEEERWTGGEGRRTRKRKKKRSSCSRLSGSHI